MVTEELRAKLSSLTHPDWIQMLRRAWRLETDERGVAVDRETFEALEDYWLRNVRNFLDIARFDGTTTTLMLWGIGRFRMSEEKPLPHPDPQHSDLGEGGTQRATPRPAHAPRE